MAGRVAAAVEWDEPGDGEIARGVDAGAARAQGNLLRVAQGRMVRAACKQTVQSYKTQHCVLSCRQPLMHESLLVACSCAARPRSVP